MDVLKRLKLLLFFFLPSLIQCSPSAKMENGNQQFSPKPPVGCGGQAHTHRYMVRNKDGSISVLNQMSEGEVWAKLQSEDGSQWEYIEPDYKILLPQASAVSTQDLSSGADNWGVIRIQADVAWKQQITGQGVTVAVVDTGVDVAHPQLINQIAYNKGESGLDNFGRNKESNGIDDDQNGFVDDYRGFDFVTETGAVEDYGSHGTHVAGIIAAEHTSVSAQSMSMVQGVAPGAKIIPLAFIDSSGAGNLSSAIRAIDYAVLRGAHIINASWGGAGCSQILRDKIAQLQDQGILFVAAAGNSGLNIDYLPEFPASFNLFPQITVGATGALDLMTDFSNYGDTSVHLFAPGDRITSTVPGGKMASMSGTSMATPFVSGALALLKSAKPALSIGSLRQLLYESASKSRPYRNASQGRLDVGKMIELTGAH